MINNLAARAAWEASGVNRKQMFDEQVVKRPRLILARPGIIPYLPVREISARQTQ
jgi:hypothetical protein